MVTARPVLAFAPSEMPAAQKKSAPVVSVCDTPGPTTAPPDYSALDKQPLNQLVMGLFRQKMVASIGEDTAHQGYAGIIDLTRKLNTKCSGPRGTQLRTISILVSLFPSWLLLLFKVMFAGPFPEFSAKMNAWATALTCQWLMGPQVVNDVEVDGGKMGLGQGVLVERCRYLEESGCAAVCINSCKVPTQEFFATRMGVQLTMEPNYEDFSCQYSFGRTPQPQAQDPAFEAPCFAQCPTGERRPKCHKIVVDATH